MEVYQQIPAPGPVLLFGSGETTPGGRRIFESIFTKLRQGGPLADPLQVSIVETPAGFELNSAQVAGRIGGFLAQRLSNYPMQISIIPARRRGTWASPDNEEILGPLMKANLIFMGPGSPTYAARQLRGSLAWQIIQARHLMGAGLALSSAATIAAGAQALPVYEIYKVGEDPHWKEGLDFFGAYGAQVTFIPHWNNTDGGENLDTSRCFIGRERFNGLRDRLPKDQRVVGIDENTGLLIDLESKRCEVAGHGHVTLLQDRHEQAYKAGSSFSLDQLGDFSCPEPLKGIPRSVWEKIAQPESPAEETSRPPGEVLQLVAEREEARKRKDWARADQLRAQIEIRGWMIKDTAQGPQVEAKSVARGEK